MVKLINNVPCRYVDEFDTDIEFILLHKILDNSIYRRYYIKNKNNGKYKILDNGAYELGTGLDNKILVYWANRLNVNEVLAPDVFGDKDKTLEMFNNFVLKCPRNFKIQAIPQGKTEEERMDCLYVMLKNPRVDVIGFNKLWNRNSDKFKQIASMVFNNCKEIHLLGVNSLKDWVHLYSNDFIRSADSSILSKIISGQEDTWELKFNPKELEILGRLDKEVKQWQK